MFAKVKSKKGFTLVELIVVLVILAILAALLVPALTGYIDKAKEKKIVAETRMVVMAVQTELATAHGEGWGKQLPADWFTIPSISSSSPSYEGKHITEIKKLAEVFDTNPKATFTANFDENGKLVFVKFNDGVYTCTYTAENGTYEIEKKQETLNNSIDDGSSSKP